MEENKTNIEKTPLYIYFVCIDFWSRPIYKTKDFNVFLSSTEVLFPDKTIAPNNTEKEINKYFRENIDKLTIHGTNIDDDPLGTKVNSKFDIVIIDNYNKGYLTMHRKIEKLEVHQYAPELNTLIFKDGTTKKVAGCTTIESAILKLIK